MNTPVEVLVTVPFPDEQKEKLQEVSSRLKFHFEPARQADDISDGLWEKVEVLYTERVLPTAEQAPALRWVQIHLASADTLAANPLWQKDDLIATTLSGAAAPQTAEYALGLLLAMGRKLPEILTLNQAGEWPKERWERFQGRELRGSTVGIIGYGSIGRELARLLQSVGAIVLAAKRDARKPEDEGFTFEGLGDPEGNCFTRLYPWQALETMVATCDFVVVCVPLTSETRGLVGEKLLKAFKPDAFLVHIGRAGVVDQDALLDALKEKQLAGAALDVFKEEPLPTDSPFWKMPNVIVSPHVAGISPYYMERAVKLFSENLTRYLNGSPLLNRFDPERGY